MADADDSSANGGSLCGKTSGQPGWNTQTTYTYYADGSTSASQTPAQRAGGVATTYTYDADGNEATETHHFGCISGASCTSGVTQKWYDGADRLVEVALPHDPSDYYATQWLTRYLYDVTAGGSVSIGSTSFKAYGNLFKTQELVPGAGGGATWIDQKGSAFDPLDRVVTKYSFSPSSNTVLRSTTMAYDASTATLGLLASQTDPLGEITSYTYDALAHPTLISYSGDGGATPSKTLVYDAVGRAVSATGGQFTTPGGAIATYGTESWSFDADGRVKAYQEPASGSVTSPARLTYDYYPNGQRKDINVASGALTAAPLMSYAYRTDGKRTKLHVGYGQQQGDFVSALTAAGRETSRTDPFTGTAMPSPAAPVSAGTLYSATSWLYDTTGQLARLQLPETLMYTFSHDDEGHTVSWYASNSRNGPVTVALTNTIRGENVMQTLIGTGSSIVYGAAIANGATVRTHPRAPGQPPDHFTTSVDPVNAALTGTSKEIWFQYNDPDQTPPQGWVDCGNTATTYNFDAASRHVSNTVQTSITNPSPYCVSSDGTSSGPTTPSGNPNAFDAENHQTQIAPNIDGTSGIIRWNSTGHAYQMGATSVHHDGDGLLFTTDSTGALAQVKIETLADIAANGQLSVLDRNQSGQLVTQHDNMAYGGINLGSTIYRTKGASTSVPYIFPGSNNNDVCTCGGDFEYNRLEGFDFRSMTLQGARVMDNSIGQWTTPDAYAGDVHDPMSQKPFMWDRNNPYQYSDPSGYYAGIPDASGNPFFAVSDAWWASHGQADADGLDTSSASGSSDKPGDPPTLSPELKKIIKGPPSKPGNAPIGIDGKPIELHHDDQKDDGKLHPMTREQHRGGDNYAKNHPNTGGKPSNINRGAFRRTRRMFWIPLFKAIIKWLDEARKEAQRQRDLDL